MSATRKQLRTLYASGLPPQLMRAPSARRIRRAARILAALRMQWGGHAPFDGWFGQEINNAHLASVATYYACVPGFERELQAVGGDLPAFYRRVRALAKLDQETARSAGVRNDRAGA